MTGFNSKRDAAADKLQEDLINYGTSWSQDGKRIDPMSVYKEPAQEPVAWMYQHPNNHRKTCYQTYKPSGECTPLYTAPPQREWVGLTDDKRGDIAIDSNCSFFLRDYPKSMCRFAQAIEQALKEKNT